MASPSGYRLDVCVPRFASELPVAEVRDVRGRYGAAGLECSARVSPREIAMAAAVLRGGRSSGGLLFFRLGSSDAVL